MGSRAPRWGARLAPDRSPKAAESQRSGQGARGSVASRALSPPLNLAGQIPEPLGVWRSGGSRQGSRQTAPPGGFSDVSEKTNRCPGRRGPGGGGSGSAWRDTPCLTPAASGARGPGSRFFAAAARGTARARRGSPRVASGSTHYSSGSRPPAF